MSVKIPTWQDVGLPPTIVDHFKEISDQKMLVFLINDRVLHSSNKIHYLYTCCSCGHEKVVHRQYEDYAACEQCNGLVVRGSPFLTESRYSQNYEDLDPNKIIKRMQLNCALYFGEVITDVVTLGWQHNSFACTFYGGCLVRSNNPTWAIAMAAIACPFLWDTKFNWRNNTFSGDRDLHMIHIINQMAGN